MKTAYAAVFFDYRGGSAEKVLTGEAAFGSVYTLHRSRGLFRSAV